MRTKVTPEVVQKVKKYLYDEKYLSLTLEEIASLTGTSPTTVHRIKTGEYDIQQTELKNVVAAQIEYNELHHLFECEAIVKELLEISILSDVDEDTLYFPRKTSHIIINRHVPDMVAARLEYLHTTAD